MASSQFWKWNVVVSFFWRSSAERSVLITSSSIVESNVTWGRSARNANSVNSSPLPNSKVPLWPRITCLIRDRSLHIVAVISPWQPSW